MKIDTRKLDRIISDAMQANGAYRAAIEMATAASQDAKECRRTALLNYGKYRSGTAFASDLLRLPTEQLRALTQAEIAPFGIPRREIDRIVIAEERIPELQRAAQAAGERAHAALALSTNLERFAAQHGVPA